MKKKKPDLEKEALRTELSIYQELAFALLRKERPDAIASGPHAVWVIALDRAHGGLVAVTDIDVMTPPSGPWQYLERWCGLESVQADPYLRWAYDAAKRGAKNVR